MPSEQFAGHRLVSPFGVISDVAALPVMRGLPGLTVFQARIGSGLPGIGYSGSQEDMPMGGAGSSVDDPSAAQTVAIAEAAERYASGDFLGERVIWSRASELGRDALDLAGIPRCSPGEYAGPRCPLTRPDPVARIRWVSGIDLTTGRELLVPAVMACYRLHDVRPSERFWYQISTGYAVHTDPAEALVRGICEVIERDAIAITWLQQLRLPRLDPVSCAASSEGATTSAASFAQVLEWCDSHFIKTYLFDATTDLGVPTAYCVQVADHDDRVHQVVGCSTGRDLPSAARKAILEALLVRRMLQAGDVVPRSPEEFSSFQDGGRYMAARERLCAFEFLLNRPVQDRTGPMHHWLPGESAAALQYLITMLAGHGAQVIAVDRTPRELADVGLTAVCVLIPELQPMSLIPAAQFRGHDRLTRAPAAMGFPPLREEAMNPWPQPFI
jgi:ribosomal protein S12 methylthiotransferase accessory factor